MNPIEVFYRNSTVLVTGPNGFLGTVLLEKLLRCFDVKKIFMLIRSKAGQSVRQRHQSFISLQIFDLIRKEDPRLFEKLVAVEVDYTSHDLGIDCEVLSQIEEEVDVVFNIVASVKFNEALNDAIQINILGTKKIVNLTLGIKKLKSFVHVSTLYSNCNRTDIDEKIYPNSLTYQDLIQIGHLFKDKENIIDSESLIFQKLPNTYTLTKHFAEKLVNHQAFYAPTGIFRPPIVISNYKDIPGYTDNLNGPSGIVAWTVRGYIHCIYGNSEIRSNLVPVDYCINALITTAWDVHRNFDERTTKGLEVPIYNYISKANNLTWGKYMSLVPLGFHEPLQKSVWFYSYFIVSSNPVFKLLNFIYHTIPGCLMDFAAFLVGKKMIYSKAYKKIEKVLLMMSYFGTREWNFSNNNVERLIEETKAFDFERGDLNFNIRTINWNEYFRNYIPGIKRYYFKENCDDLRGLKSTYEWIKRIHIIVKYFSYIFLTKKMFNLLIFLLKFTQKFKITHSAKRNIRPF